MFAPTTRVNRRVRSAAARVRYEERRGVHMRAVLEMRDARTGQWRPVGDAVVPYPNVQRAIALQHRRPDLLPENSPPLTEVGWFGSSFVRKVKRAAKKVARSKIGKIAGQVVGVAADVQKLGAQALAATGVPVFSDAGKAYLKVLAPVVDKLVGKHASPWDLIAGKARKRLPSVTSAAERAHLESVIKVSRAKAAQGRKLALDVATRVARKPLASAAAAAKKAVHRADAVKVVMPSGNTFWVSPT